MNLPSTRWAAPLLLCLPLSAAAETITVEGREIQGAEMAEIGEGGVYYQVPGGGHVLAPWDELNQFQLSAVKSRFAAALDNLRLRAFWVEGTVFDKLPDGVVVQVNLDLEGGDEEDEAKRVPYREGAELAKGLVLVRDLPDAAAKKEGDPVSGPFYRDGSFTYEIAGFNLVRELPALRQSKPEWGAEREWTNREGARMRAKVIAVREGKCLFEQGGRTFPYEIDQLSDADQELVADFVRRARPLPVF